MKQKKLMILGGGGRQLLPLIQASKNEGYYTILVGNINKAPGIDICDKHYNEDCTDVDKILEIARNEKIDGVLGNAEYAMHYVSEVAGKLGLIGNPVKAVDLLNSKAEFRNLTKNLGFYAPKSVLTESFSDVLVKVDFEHISFPIVMKPEKCSGSSGTTVINSKKELKKSEWKWNICRDYSKTKKVVIEEYVKMADLTNVIDGDIFVHRGKIIWNGLFSNGRSKYDILFPMSQSYPINLDEKQMTEVKESLCALIKNAGITFGALNIEAFYTEDDKLFFIEINARQGGNGIPYMIKKHCGIDMSRLLVTTATGDDTYFNDVLTTKHCSRLVSRLQCFWHAEAGQYNSIDVMGGGISRYLCFPRNQKLYYGYEYAC